MPPPRRRTKSGVSSLILSSLPSCHTHATSRLTDTHTIPFRGRVCVWRFRHASDNASHQPTRLLQPIIANVRPALGCVHGHSSRTPTIALPQHVLVEPSPLGTLHRISVSVLFRFYISYFRFGFGFIISARQRALTNADKRTIHIRQFPTPLAQCRVGHYDLPYHQQRLTLHTCHPEVSHSDLPHHQIPINAIEGRKPTTDPCRSIGPGKGRKHASDPHPPKRGYIEGRKRTSNPIPSNDIAYRLRAKINSRQATRQPTYLPETIFVYARNYSTQNRVQIPPTPTPPSQTPMFPGFDVLYHNFSECVQWGAGDRERGKMPRHK